MYQHVEGHTGSHELVDCFTGDVIYVSSTHHQMMKPSPESELVAFSLKHGKREWYEGYKFKSDNSDKDVEVVYYPDTNSLCFQPHPEFQSAEFEGMRLYFKSLLDRFLKMDAESPQEALQAD